MQVRSAASNSTLKCLEKLQEKAIRIINLAPYNCHTEPLFKKCEILSLKCLIKFFKISFMYEKLGVDCIQYKVKNSVVPT
jgi:hypothetical protein